MILNTITSLNWFQNLFTRSKKENSKVKTLIGKLIYFSYDPKSKDTISYYDANPLLLVLNMDSTYISGLNVHYLNDKLRFRIINDLQQYGPETEISTMAEKIKELMNNSLFKMCYKKYLTQNIKNLVVIPNFEWSNMLYLPTHNFQKKTASEIWKITEEKAKK